MQLLEVSGAVRHIYVIRQLMVNDLYSSRNIVVIKSRRMRWTWYLARMERCELYTGFWWGNLKERNHLEDSGVDGRMILIWICIKWDRGMDWIDLDQDRNKWHTCKCGNEPAGP